MSNQRGKFFIGLGKFCAYVIFILFMGLLIPWVILVVFGDMTSREFFNILYTEYVQALLNKLKTIQQSFGVS